MLPHDFNFDPTSGHDEPQLRAVRAGPTVAGFEAFWRDTYARAASTSPRARMQPSTMLVRGRLVHDIEFDGIDGFRVGGWLTLPESGAVTCGIVFGHGYGGRSSPDAPIPLDDAAVILPCARGFNRSARPDLPADSMRHVLYGIESVETYLHRFCVSDLWSATSALVELVPDVGTKLFYCGESFGGGIGALALPWEPRWRAAFVDVPSFGNHPLRVTLPCVGSGESVRQYFQTHPAVMDVLAFYDSAVASRFTRIPTFVGAALFDPAVPPPGQFSVFNELTCEKQLYVRRAAHFVWPGQTSDERAIRRAVRTWFGNQLNR